MNKKADMPFWMILMILAVLFLVIVSLIAGGVFRGFVEDIIGVRAVQPPPECLIKLVEGPDDDDDGYHDTKAYKVSDKKWACCDKDAKDPNPDTATCTYTPKSK